MTLQLSQDQQAAYDKMVDFICDPSKTAFVLEGYAGTGKSTLMQHFLDQLSKMNKTFKLLNPQFREPDVELTATTHKACENLSDITGAHVPTIHSILGQTLRKDFRTGKSTLVDKPNFDPPENTVIIIDEASYLDGSLLEKCFSRTQNCKIIFMGDPAQLVPVGYKYAPVFKAGFDTARLSQVHRNGGRILELATKFREVVETGQWFNFTPDGNEVVHLERQAFNKMIEEEFTRPDWTFKDSRFLSWTNNRAVEYNGYIRSLAKGDPNFQVGDYAVVNEYLHLGQGKDFRNNVTVHITAIEPEERLGIQGAVYTINGVPVFRAYDLNEHRKAMALARREEDWSSVAEMEKWADLRALYAETVNKSQGSTYGKVFIDLDDISRVNSGDQLARMLYVATSRAKHQVIFTGDFV